MLTNIHIHGSQQYLIIVIADLSYQHIIIMDRIQLLKSALEKYNIEISITFMQPNGIN